MRIFVSILVALVGAAAFSAHAADIRPSTKDTPAHLLPSAEPQVNWTGFYAGATIGYGNANHEVSADYAYEGGSYNLLNLDGLSSSGLVGGMNAGFDIARGRVLFGVLGGYTFDGMETMFSAGDGGFKASLEKQDEWYLGARAGLLVSQQTLIYIGAAYVQTEYELSSGGFSLSKDYDGVKALAGIETHIGGGVFAKLEYQHDFYGDVDWVNEGGFKITDTLDEDKVLLGVSYKFGAFGLN